MQNILFAPLLGAKIFITRHINATNEDKHTTYVLNPRKRTRAFP